MKVIELKFGLGDRVEEMSRRLADALKDALLDLGSGSGPARSECPALPLPPLSRDEFLEVMSGEVEETLHEVACVINEVIAPSALFVAESQIPGRPSLLVGYESDAVPRAERLVGDIFSKLWRAAFEVGASHAGRCRLCPPPRLPQTARGEEVSVHEGGGDGLKLPAELQARGTAGSWAG